MRIDYTLVSESLLGEEGGLEIARAEVLGRGIDMKGFHGSDHCPILLELKATKRENQLKQLMGLMM